MSSFFTILLIGISLSMDAFSLALIYGMIGMSIKKKIILSLIVGFYHFFMPLIGLTFGNIIDNISFINLHLITVIILIYIGLDLIISNKDNHISISKTSLLMFGLSVSIDSLTVGIGLKALTNNYIISALTFSICSSIFTYSGLMLGNIIGQRVGNYSKNIGGLILIVIAILMFINKY